jgi:YVTN family beta-propeller protein
MNEIRLGKIVLQAAVVVLFVVGLALPSGATPAFTGPFAYVTNQSDGTVTVIDTPTHSFVATISLPGCGDNCKAAPKGLAVTPNGKFVYVAISNEGAVAVIDASTNTVSATISLLPICECLAIPTGVAITPDGSRAYVTVSNSNAILVIDSNPSDVGYNTGMGDITVGSNPTAIAISPDGLAAYYTFGASSLGRIDTNPLSPTYNTQTTTIAVGSSPTGVAVTPDSAFIYVTNNVDNTVSVIPNTFPTFSPITTVSVSPDTGPFSVAITPNGAFAYVVNRSSGTISVINTSTKAVTAVTGLCLPDDQIAITPDGTEAYAPDSECTRADVVSTASNMLTAHVAVGSGPFGVAIGPASNSDTRIIQFPASGSPETRIATVGNTGDPAAQSLALTLSSVTNPINVSVTFFYEPTDVSTGTTGVGIADGDCENGATEATDFDCRWVPDFVYPSGPNLPAGDKLVPHIIASHNKLGVWVRVIATVVSTGLPAVAGTDYGFGVDWFYAWTKNPPLAAPPPTANYLSGWNNLNPQMYDRPGQNLDIAFVANITTITKFNCDPNCVGTADPGTGGHTGTLNDIVVADPPNPPSGVPDVVQVILPQNGRNPFPYLKGLPMLVAFTLENESAEKSDPTALTLPHSVSVATLDSTGAPITVQFPKGFPTTFTYNPFLKVYYIFLSPAPYKTDGTVYTMQIDSDLFPQPVLVNFVVKNSLF